MMAIAYLMPRVMILLLGGQRDPASPSKGMMEETNLVAKGYIFSEDSYFQGSPRNLSTE